LLHRVFPDAHVVGSDFPCNQALTLTGPAGVLEAVTQCPALHPRRASAVILHPHPLHGGTLHNKVVTTLAREFAEQGVASVRFNFRGVGASAGSFDHARGETDDALAAIDWLREQCPRDDIWLAGFSFGAMVALRAAVTGRVAGVITVAPAVQLYDWPDVALPECPWLLVMGEADEVVPVKTVRDWLSRLPRQPETVFLPEAGHFFHQRLHALRAAVGAFMPRHLP
jgi:uncharacterized protein